MHAPEYSVETVDGKQLNVACWRHKGPANGNRPILFFNGIGANTEVAAPLPERLNDRDFITFDMPGVGDSPETAVPYNAIWMARISALILDRYGMGEIDVMGVSWGGAMAQQFALQHGRRVNRLILVATTAGMIMVPGKFEALSKMIDPRRYIDPEFMKKHFATLYGGTHDPHDSKGHVHRIKPPSKMGYFLQLLAIAGWTSAPFLPFMNIPTLIMTGDRDPIVRPINGQILHALIPNSQLEIVPDGGHLFMLSHAEEFVAHVRRFLGEGDEDGAAEAA
ncbi:MAG: alpha/beta fold hydrolase [Sphingomonadaceae bacterium]|nr:alpha/beta fold hydrolase [Sphingomonadaceae bacterium]